ncbi:MAG: heme-binding protein [Lachnospiraceae bacterium]|nr:heme-binding protein [Lachnospiraceae bacterium]
MQEQDVNKIVSSVMEAMTDTVSVHISLKQAKALIEKVEEKAKEMGVNAVIAVSNACANPVAVHCMDNSYIASYDVAFQKAYTVVALKMSTIELKSLSQPGGPLYGIQHTNQGRIVIFGGGEPLKANGRIVGGLGVSGGSEEQDTALAAYGSQVFNKEVLKWQ